MGGIKDMIKIAPSLLSADFYNLEKEIEMLEKAKADYIHFDVMDGAFVPNISFGLPVIECLKPKTTIPFDVHLMIENPENYLARFIDAGADIVTFHVEATVHVHRAIQMIKEKGAKAGVVLNPHTPLSQAEHVLSELDMVLLMSVNPGYGGQKLIPEILEKGKSLRKMIEDKGLDIDLEIDGGVNPDNAARIAEFGFNIFVAGSAVFGADDPISAIKKIKGE
jgi:ribulose-phosphate 3-epimerase